MAACGPASESATGTRLLRSTTSSQLSGAWGRDRHAALLLVWQSQAAGPIAIHATHSSPWPPRPSGHASAPAHQNGITRRVAASSRGRRLPDVRVIEHDQVETGGEVANQMRFEVIQWVLRPTQQSCRGDALCGCGERIEPAGMVPRKSMKTHVHQASPAPRCIRSSDRRIAEFGPISADGAGLRVGGWARGDRLQNRLFLEVRFVMATSTLDARLLSPCVAQTSAGATGVIIAPQIEPKPAAR